MLATALLASAALIYALRGDDRLGKHFHALFQFQLLGINGAFLTGDLFNLFVFFEILLIASYALLLHGGGAGRVRAGVHYVVLNLVGSAFFLIAVGTLYGLTGTLNMAHMAQKSAVAQLSAEQAPLVARGGAPAAGGVRAQGGAVAAVLLAAQGLRRGHRAGGGAVRDHDQGRHLLDPAGLHADLRRCRRRAGQPGAGLAVAAGPGRHRRRCAGGTRGDHAAKPCCPTWWWSRPVPSWRPWPWAAPEALAAALYYLLHSTWIAGGLFLLADLVARQRGDKAGRLVQGPALLQPQLLGGAFFIGAIAVAGLPPLSGFFGKVMLLRSVTGGSEAVALWSVVLGSGLVALVALSRAGSTLFWRTGHTVLGSAEREPVKLLATFGLLASAPLMVVAARPLLAYAQATAAQLLDPGLYRQAITCWEVAHDQPLVAASLLRVRLIPLLSGVLLLSWLLLVNDFSLGHWLLGAFLGVTIPLLCRNLLLSAPRIQRPGLLLRFIGLVL